MHLSQVRVIALGCAADLLKENEAKKIAADNSEFIPTLLNALKVQHLTSPSHLRLPCHCRIAQTAQSLILGRQCKSRTAFAEGDAL